MRIISLTNSKVAIVDDDDYEWLVVHQWSARRGRRGAWYAQRMVTGCDVAICSQMQREIMDPQRLVPGRSLFVDHINFDTLDNRRHNLRWLTPRDSALSRRTFLTNQSGYRGVSFSKGHRPDKAWRCCLMSLGIRYLSYHATADEAARVYNDLARQHHGEHAHINIIQEGPSQ